MRFHVISLAHTNTTAAFPSCAFTNKVMRFCQMMKDRGHTVILYAGNENDAPCDELVTCLSKKQRLKMVGGKHYTEADWNHPQRNVFNQNVIKGMKQRIQPHDFICLIGGISQKSIADAFPAHLSVEFGIGYSGTFAKFRVFESYAWMHMVYGAESGGAGMAHTKDGNWFDAVIPNQIVDGLYPFNDTPEDYYLYMGRIVDRKGYKIAQEACEAAGKRLILAGPGHVEGYGEHVGEVDAIGRAELMSKAIALIAPTHYIEPFGTVTIEAMACGTPVISSDWGAFTETIEQGVHGFRCRTFKDFITALDDVRTLDRSVIHDDAVRRFSMATVGDQYERYFEQLSSLWYAGWYSR